jgi:hypothetical protein
MAGFQVTFFTISWLCLLPCSFQFEVPTAGANLNILCLLRFYPRKKEHCPPSKKHKKRANILAIILTRSLLFLNQPVAKEMIYTDSRSSVITKGGVQSETPIEHCTRSDDGMPQRG